MDNANNGNIIKVLEDLSAGKGGSLVKRVKKLKLTESSSTLFVGLGGMGCKTINKIKEIYLKEFERTDKVDFLAIDTDNKSLTEVRVSANGTGGGYLKSEDETVQIYTDTIADILTDKTPTEVLGWLGDVPRITLSPTGAGGVRQYARVMLCGNTKRYDEIKGKIRKKVEHLCGLAPINVVLISGIAGGTGSGTFVDIAYMIKDVLKEYFADNRNKCEFWGVFYTPDVQKNVPEIKTDEAKWIPLQRNGYAAFKELDYYMSNGTEDGANGIVYKLNMPGGRVVMSSDAMFKSGNAFIVSATPELQDRDEIISATAKSIMNMYYKVEVANGAAAGSDATSQSIISTYCNVAPSILPAWCNIKVGVDAKGNPNGAGVENCDFPAHMNYLYSAFGYKSMYLPRDEIMAYLANKVFVKLIDKWRGKNTQKKIDDILKTYKIFNIPTIANSLRTKLVPDENQLHLSDQEKPTKKSYLSGIFAADSYSGIEDAITYVTNKVNTIINTFANQDAQLKIAASLTSGLCTYLRSSDYMVAHGPYEAIEVLSGLSDGSLKGAINYLAQMSVDLSNDNSQVMQTVSKQYTDAKTTLDNCKQVMLNDRTPTQGEIDEYIACCYTFQKAYLEFSMYKRILPGVIKCMRALLSNENKRTFDVYVTIIDQLKDMLNEDSMILATSRESRHGNVHTYGLDALGVAEAKDNEDKFTKLFDGYINDTRVNNFCASFVNSILGSEQREKWENLIEIPERMADEIRRIFAEFADPFMKDILDKFCVIAYAEESDDFKLDADNIEYFWSLTSEETDPVKISQYEWLCNTIKSAANKIINELGVSNADSASVMIREENEALKGARNAAGTLMLLEETPRLNAAIKNILGDICSYATVSSECKSVVSYVVYKYPYAIPLVYRMREYAQQYYSSETNQATRAGRHLDEKSQNWVEYLPELYGVDTERYYTSKVNGAAMAINYPNEAHDKVMYEKIRNAYEYGVAKGYIYQGNSGNGTIEYKIITLPKLETDKQKLIALHKEALEANDKTSFISLLAKDETIEKIEVRIKSTNDPLMGLIGCVSEGVDGLKNIYRVIRSNMNILRLVLDAEKEYRESKIFDVFDKDVEEHRKKVTEIIEGEKAKKLYDEKIVLFSYMFFSKLIKHDMDAKVWYFTLEKLENGAEDNRKWFELFRYSGLRSELDKLTTLYQVFNAFCMLDDEYVEAITEITQSVLGEGDEKYIEKRADIRKECEEIIVNEFFTSIPAKQRFAKIDEEYQKSFKKDYYQLPKAYDGPETLLENIVTFYKDLNSRLGMI